ncbi:MAG TPA: hypothetical protein VG712_05475 [Gemmatimonadales bacterium]|nr:hypothetical protein [Gemmatimonadales bacterium]
MTDNPFDHTRDEALGAALRAHLEPAGHAAFVAQVRARMAGASAAGPFEILGAWMRPGIAAAALIAAAAGWWLTTGTRTDVASTTTPVEVFAAGGGTDVMLASALEGR